MSDYIERKSIRNLYSCLNPEDKVRVAQVLIDIDAIPSADAVSLEEFEQMRFLADKSMEMVGEERPKGEWIKEHGVVYCSNCNHSHWSDCYEDTVVRFNFCPNCGSDNRERNNDDFVEQW